MAFTTTAQWEVRTTGADTQAGIFDPGVIGFATDGACTSGTGSSPVFTSASYTFVAGDVGAWLYIAAGTNWLPGWYKIASVATGAATLSAGIGAGVLLGSSVTTVAGVSSAATNTGATWGVDYSQQDAAQISFTDMVIGATTTQFTSAANPVGKNFVGNGINVTSGTGFTVQRVVVVSTSGTTATCDKSLGTAASTGGNGKLGGAVATLATAVTTNAVAGNQVFIKPGTYTTTADTVITNGKVNIIGYSTVRFDDAGTITITTATNSINLLKYNGSSTDLFVLQNVTLTTTAATPGVGIQANGVAPGIMLSKVKLSGFQYGIQSNNGTFNYFGSILLQSTEITACTTWGILCNTGQDMEVVDSYIHGNGGSGTGTATGGISANLAKSLTIERSFIAANAGVGVSSNCPMIRFRDSVIYGQTGSGGTGGGSGAYLAPAPGIIQNQNNIWYGNAGWGIYVAAGSTIAGQTAGANAYGSNTSGNRGSASASCLPKGSSADVILSANPFTNAGSGDFSLNATTGGGAACKGAGVPGTFPGSASVGHLDIGAVQGTGSGSGSSSSNSPTVFVLG